MTFSLRSCEYQWKISLKKPQYSIISRLQGDSNLSPQTRKFVCVQTLKNQVWDNGKKSLLAGPTLVYFNL